MPRTPTAAVRWRAVLDEFHHSGLKQAEFCRHRGLSLHTFRKYLYGSRSSGPIDPPAMFLPVTAPADPPDAGRAAPATDPLVLILACGRRVAVAPGFDPDTLLRLLDALGGRP